jgi:ABC-type uncharacterized transport system permease subunit
MQVNAEIPPQMVDVLQGTILFFLAADIVIRRWFRIRAAGAAGEAKADAATISRSYGSGA